MIYLAGNICTVEMTLTSDNVDNKTGLIKKYFLVLKIDIIVFDILFRSYLDTITKCNGNLFRLL